MDNEQLRSKFEGSFNIDPVIEFSDEYNYYVSSVLGDTYGGYVQMRWESYQQCAKDMQAEIDALTKELDIKIADAIEAAAKAIQHDQVNYDGTDATVFHIDELLDYAEMIRNGN